MKKLYMAVALAGALSAPTLQAAMQITPTRDLLNYSSGSGGEFRAAPNAALGSLVQWGNYVDSSTIGTRNGTLNFQTFCLEAGEHFNPGSTYDVVLNNGAVYGGGGGGTGLYDPLSVGTAYLYSEFAKGTLTGYNYTYGANRVASAGDLQQAIWYLEDEGGSLSATIQNILQTEFGALSTSANWKANASPWAYGVGVMNLWDPGFVGVRGHQRQDMLTMVPEPTTMIAGALLLLPFGVSTLRRMRKTS